MKIVEIKKNKLNNMVLIEDWSHTEELQCTSSSEVESVLHFIDSEIKDIDYLCIPLNKSYKNIATQLYSSIKLVITEKEMMTFLRFMFGDSFVDYMEEVAACSECDEVISADIVTFFIQFYQTETKEEAEHLYNAWQEHIPLNDKVFHVLLKILETYRTEILNYFEIKHHKREGST